MIYCYDKRYPLESFEEEIESCQKENPVVFYDDEKEVFVDLEGNVVSIENQVLLGRTWANHIKELDDVILSCGGILAIDEEETEKIALWPKYYQPKRKAFIFTGEELLDEEIVLRLESTFGKEIFIKTIEKNFNSVIPTSVLKDKNCVFYHALTNHREDAFIVSGKVDILRDQYGLLEYRCFVMNGKVANVSRMTDEILHDIDIEVVSRLQEIVEQMRNAFPSFYVVDVFAYDLNGKREIDVVEFNPFQASGCYLYNSAVEISKDLTHQDLKCVPRERQKSLEQMSEGEQMIEEREPKYGAPFSFANDLRSIFVSGNIGMIHTTRKIRKEDFASPVRNTWKDITLITSDACLGDDSFMHILSSDQDLESRKDSSKEAKKQLVKSEF